MLLVESRNGLERELAVRGLLVISTMMVGTVAPWVSSMVGRLRGYPEPALLISISTKSQSTRGYHEKHHSSIMRWVTVGRPEQQWM